MRLTPVQRRARRLLRAAGIEPIVVLISAFAAAAPPFAALLITDAGLWVVAALAAFTIVMIGGLSGRERALEELRATAKAAATESAAPQLNTELVLAVLDELAGDSYPLPYWMQGDIPGQGAYRSARSRMSGPMYKLLTSELRSPAGMSGSVDGVPLALGAQRHRQRDANDPGPGRSATGPRRALVGVGRDAAWSCRS